MRKSGCASSNELFPPINYSSHFTQWLLKDSRCESSQWSGSTTSSSTKKSSHAPPQNTRRHNMELIQLLAINALEFTAPVYSFLNKDCNKPAPVPEPIPTSTQADIKLEREFIQLSGHPGSFATAGPNSIWKKMPSDSVNEANVYEKLRDAPNDPMKSLVPTFISRTEWNGNCFIELEDLVTRFNVDNLNIIDLKLGIRTFLESEASNSKPRSDLYEKMSSLDPSAPTASENESKSVTKLRYMQFREELSSTKNLGFRIEGVKTRGGSHNQTNLQLLKDEAKIREILLNFTGGMDFLSELIELREKLENSEFFMSHEIIGCSLLLIHDFRKRGAWIIDFAKSFLVDTSGNCGSGGISGSGGSSGSGGIRHRGEWCMGNREDGVLTGIDNIIRLLK